MAEAGELKITFKEMIDSLVEMAKLTTTDQSQNNYCRYINAFLSHFGEERVMLVGSTKEETRLHIGKDRGDYDFLIISDVVIPTECIHYIQDLPLFVHIDGIPFRNKFPGVQLIDGKYLPSSLLSECRPEAFKHSCYLFQMVTNANITIFENKVMNINIGCRIKPGKSLETYEGVEHPEFDITPDQKQIYPAQILQFVQDNICKFYSEDENNIFGKVFHILKGVDEKSNNKHASNMYQHYGSVIDAFCMLFKPLGGSVENINSPVIDDVTNLQPYFTSKTNKQDAKTNSNNPCTDVLHDKSNKYVLSENEEGSGVSIKFCQKSHRDFIPAFPLSGKPKFLEAWKDRERYWPTQSVVDDIYNSEFFVVAKPAIQWPNKLKDFCLAYNIAETKMAQAMTPVQKKVVLILKALQKSVLSEFSRNLTTYHWKTVLYWTSEKWHQSPIMEDDEATVLLFLRNVLQSMTDCLCKQDLQHYFIPSNLLADMEASRAYEIVSKIIDIQEDPTRAVYQFFATQILVPPAHQYEFISRKHIEECKALSLGTQSVKTKTGQIISFLDSVSTNQKQSGVLIEALTDVFLNCLPDFKDEAETDEQFEGNEENVSLDEIVNSFSRYLMVPESDKHEMKEAKEQLVRLILEVYPKNRKKMNML